MSHLLILPQLIGQVVLDNLLELAEQPPDRPLWRDILEGGSVSGSICNGPWPSSPLRSSCHSPSSPWDCPPPHFPSQSVAGIILREYGRHRRHGLVEPVTYACLSLCRDGLFKAQH